MSAQWMAAVALGFSLVAAIGLEIAGFHGWIVTVIAAALAVTLFVQMRVRHQLEALMLEAWQFRAALGDVLVATAKSPFRSTASLDAGLRRIAEAVGVDDLWIWHLGDAADPGWTSSRLLGGQPVMFTRADELPRPLRERLGARPWPLSVIATPLDADGTVLDALFWVWRSSRRCPPEQIDRFRVFSILIACDAQRKRADEAVQDALALKSAILSSLPAQVAVLDRHGAVIAVNEAWKPSLGTSSDCSIAPGVNFLDMCRAAANGGRGDAAAAGVADVCGGAGEDFELEYRQAYADGERWFVLKAAPLKREEGGAVVTRSEITTRKRAEMLIRENEARFRRLADTMPLGVWMSGVDGRYEYFNRTWLDMTGRTIEHELGVGWLETVHPDDRERCMGTYLRAFAARKPFSMEYRIRRHDGQYRWLLDKGAPRYDGETFAGYLGGAIDFTDQRDAEQALRQLSGKLIAAQEDERRRIARDLHDSVAQRMALISIRLHELRQQLQAGTVVSTLVNQLWQDSEIVGAEVHSLSHRLHSAKLDALGLVPAIAGECSDMSERGVSVNFSERDVPPVSREVALCLFRIAQEALSNVVKHSSAKTARVTITGAGDTVVLTVEDGGVGFVADARVEGLGLVSIRERVRSVGGVLAVRSAPGQGTAVEARVPAQSFPSASFDSLEELSRRTALSPPLFRSNGSQTSPG